MVRVIIKQAHANTDFRPDLQYFQMLNQNENWMPLESNPEVINPFINKMGLKTELFSFQEMLSIQEWALEMIPQPVLGIIMLYQETPVQLAFKNQQADQLDPALVPNDMFYMKQYAQNACGTIALFHVILNGMKQYPDMVEPNSKLLNFFEQAKTKPNEDKGKLFQSSEEIKTEHKSASNQGQSAVASDCDSHFIAFVQSDGYLWELDGMKKCPVRLCPCTAEEILVKGSSEIKKYMDRDPDNINFSMIVLAKTAQ